VDEQTHSVRKYIVEKATMVKPKEKARKAKRKKRNQQHPMGQH